MNEQASKTMTPTLVKEGNTIEIPSEFAQHLGIAPGSQVYLYRLDDTLSVRTKSSPLLEACEEFEATMLEEGVTVDNLLEGLEEEREKLAKEH